jgi:CIC family chloride channel protein
MFDQTKYDTVKVYELMRICEHKVCHDEHMEEVMSKFEKSGVWNLPVVDAGGRYMGFISKSKIFSSYREQLQQVSHD